MRRVFEARASTILYKIFINQPRDAKWLIPANVCPIVPAALIKAQRSFEFVDINADSLLMSEETVLAKIRPSPGDYAGILWVDTYGLENDAEPFFKKIKSLNPELVAVHDRCLAPPAFKEELSDHTDAVIYSTGYGKYVDIGFGGYGWLQDHLGYSENVAEYNEAALKMLNVFLKSSPEEAKQQGYEVCRKNWLEMKPPEMEFQHYQMDVLQEFSKARDHKARINEIYRSELPESVQLPKACQNWRFNILVPEKGVLLQSVFNEGLFASSHYAPMNEFFIKGEIAPASARLHLSVVNLFNDRHFTEEQALRIVEIIKRHIDQFGSRSRFYK